MRSSCCVVSRERHGSGFKGHAAGRPPALSEAPKLPIIEAEMVRTGASSTTPTAARREPLSRPWRLLLLLLYLALGVLASPHGHAETDGGRANADGAQSRAGGTEAPPHTPGRRPSGHAPPDIAVASVQERLTYSAQRRYVFPVAAPIRFMSWTHIHWDGSNAVDIEAALDLAPGDPMYQRFVRAPVVAVTGGEARPADNIRGGTAVILEGDDGNQYYYAHLEFRTIERRRAVRRGDVLGEIGNSGKWSKYLEEHLHLSIASRHAPGLNWESDIVASEWLRETFGFGWRSGPDSSYSADVPQGWPFVTPGRVVRGFEELAAENAELAGLELAPHRVGRVRVISPLSGEINVVRGSSLGLRVQVTNRKTDASIILSGLAQVSVEDGSAVTAGDPLGHLGDGERLLYHYFSGGRLSNPQPLLGDTTPLFE